MARREVFRIAKALYIERVLSREGPPVVFNAWKPNTATSFTDVKELLKFVAWPRSTPTGVAIREWLASFEGQPPQPADIEAAQEERIKSERIKNEGFGPARTPK